MNPVAEMLLADPAPAAIWATLILLTFPALLVLGSPEAMRHPGRMIRDLLHAFRKQQFLSSRASSAQGSAQASSPDAADSDASHSEASYLDASASDASSSYASEVRVAADRAVAAAQRWQDLWEQAETAMNSAYDAWLDADARVRTAIVAARWGTPWSAPTCAEYAARERYLHRAVAAACDRGDLPAEALADAQSGDNGWDARLHPVDQELVIARATATWLRSRYEAAAEAERAAWHDVDLARRAAASLQREAFEAATEAAAPDATIEPHSPAAVTSHRPLAVPAV